MMKILNVTFGILFLGTLYDAVFFEKSTDRFA